MVKGVSAPTNKKAAQKPAAVRTVPAAAKNATVRSNSSGSGSNTKHVVRAHEPVIEDASSTSSEDDEEDEDDSVLDTDASDYDEDGDEDEEDDEEVDDDDDDDDDEFEQQSSDDSDLESDGGIGSDEDSDSDAEAAANGGAARVPVERTYRPPAAAPSRASLRRAGAATSTARKPQENGSKNSRNSNSSSSSSSSSSSVDITAQLRSGVTEAQRLLTVDDLSSDDEDAAGNTIGRVPLHWYDAYDHIGYDASGAKVVKRRGPGQPGGFDNLDLTIANRDEETKNMVYDAYNDRHVALSEREMELIRRMQAGAFAHPEFDATPDFEDYYSGIKEVMPLSAAPEPKRRFTPSKWELMRIMKIAKAMKEGRYKTLEQRDEEKRKARGGDAAENAGNVYQIWNDAEDEIVAESSNRRMKFHLPAPRMALPGHEESYNPPEEYLLTEEEIAARKDASDEFPAPGDDSDDDGGDVDKAARKKQQQKRLSFFVPKKHACMRHVAGYDNFVRERYERCLDLYLCPRTMKRRLNIDPASLIPKLPKPRELRPFPNSLCLQFVGHKGPVRSLTMSPDGGQYMASAGDDGTVRLWEVATAYCLHCWQVGKEVVGGKPGQVEPVLSVSWNPNPAHAVLAVAVGCRVVFISTGTADADSAELTATLLSGAAQAASESNGKSKAAAASDDDDDEEEEGGRAKKSAAAKDVQWRDVADANSSIAAAGIRVELELPTRVLSLAWHSKGDYLCTHTVADMQTVSDARSVSVHQLSKCRTQHPFSKTVGRVQGVQFHPSRPFLFVATQQHVKIYHLVEQRLLKRLVSNCKWLSGMDVHSSGDHVVVCSYDRRVVWFDLDLSSTPYKTLKFHEKAVRCVQFHRRYPLMASASDDGSIHIFHAGVFNDLTRNPMIVPLKILAGYHGNRGKSGSGSSGSVVCLAFHPRQPWVASAGMDGVINLFQDI